MRKFVFHFLRNHRMAFLINFFKKAGYSSLYRDLNDNRKMVQILSRDEYLQIYPAFADDLKKFAKRTGMDLSAWKPLEK